MVQGIVIPRDGGGDLRVEELTGLLDFQEVTGGWIEPIELDGVDATIYVNGALQRTPGPFNTRATALHWYHGLHRDKALLLGDAVIVRSPSRDQRRSFPWLLHALSCTTSSWCSSARTGTAGPTPRSASPRSSRRSSGRCSSMEFSSRGSTFASKRWMPAPSTHSKDSGNGEGDRCPRRPGRTAP